ncbi:bone morphogenetic protein 1 [Biomphalaria pfeifferi]|uniref:Bone morphogenetic protein 1 n=1 Tax=Biomphalaria pfeifferi TaxID=112525 RepID=A0AAD8AQ44_BIOPF|nr:bone morphogenetic protein 1 [Biomphalaria pfeifferi]
MVSHGTSLHFIVVLLSLLIDGHGFVETKPSSNFTSCSTDSDCDHGMSCVRSTCRCPMTMYYDPVLHCLPECHMVVTEPLGYIASPRNSSMYRNELFCTWSIRGRLNTFVAFNLLSLDLKASLNCANDNLEFFDGLSASSRSLGRQCGISHTTSIVSTSNLMYIVLNRSKNAGGTFAARYSIQACNMTMTETSGRIQSPGYPVRYFPNLRCFWSISVDPGMLIVLSLPNISLESSSLCVYDNVQIFDGRSTDARSLGKFCGRTFSTVISSSSSLLVMFRSDGMVESSGFFGNYTAFSCNLTTAQTFGHLTSPGYPWNYSSNVTCSMTIIGQLGTTVILSFNDLALDSCLDCFCDYVEAFDGASTRAPSLGRYCNSSANGTKSSRNLMHLLFQTDGVGVNRGFNVTFLVLGLPKGAECLSTHQCSIGVCAKGQCDCPDDQFYDSLQISCVLKYRKFHQCNDTRQCQESLTCVQGHCECLESETYDVIKAACIRRLFHGEECSLQLENICLNPEIVCRHDFENTSRCLCKENSIFNGYTCSSDDIAKIQTMVTPYKGCNEVDLVWMPAHVFSNISYQLTWFKSSAADGDRIQMTTTNTSARLTRLSPGEEYTVQICTVLAQYNFYPEIYVCMDFTVVTIPEVPGKLNRMTSSLFQVPYVLRFEPILGGAAYYELTLIDDEDTQTYKVMEPEVHISPSRLNLLQAYCIKAFNKLGESGHCQIGVVHITNSGDVLVRPTKEDSLDWKLIFTIGLGCVSFLLLVGLITLTLALRRQGRPIKKSSGNKDEFSQISFCLNPFKTMVVKGSDVKGATSEHPYDSTHLTREYGDFNLYTIPGEYGVRNADATQDAAYSNSTH